MWRARFTVPDNQYFFEERSKTAGFFRVEASPEVSTNEEFNKKLMWHMLEFLESRPGIEDSDGRAWSALLERVLGANHNPGK